MTRSSRPVPVRSCEELSPGDEVEAWHHGRLIHYGRVLAALPSMAMVWILCGRTGTRKLVDVEALGIVRIDSTDAPSADTDRPTVHPV